MPVCINEIGRFLIVRFILQLAADGTAEIVLLPAVHCEILLIALLRQQQPDLVGTGRVVVSIL